MKTAPSSTDRHEPQQRTLDRLIEKSERMVQAFRRAGGKPDPKLTLYPDATHDAWTRTCSNPELHEWFLSHCKETT